MTTMMIEAPALQTIDGLSDEQLELLAQTFDDAAEPVWIHDLSDRCLYANAGARGRKPGRDALRFQMCDYTATALAQVITAAA